MGRNLPSLRLSLLVSCGIVALSMPAAAFAQAQDASAAPQDGTVAEIVVTAQKREERLQDVPVSVNVVGAAQLDRQNVGQINDLTRSVPSLSSSGVTGATPAIRGVSTNGFTASSESAVAVVLDGVVLGRAQISELSDVERIEVLAGPQGMLFGKNASAGVINIVTKAPNPSRFEVIGHADIGDYGFQRQRLTANLPIAETAAVRINLNNRDQEGVVRNAFTGKERKLSSYGGRARLLWAPTSDLVVNIIGDWQKTGTNGVQPYTFALAQTPALQARLSACGVTASLRNELNCSEGDNKPTSRDVSYGVSGQIDYTLPGDYVLTSITANRWREGSKFGYYGQGGDTDLLPTDILSTNIAPSKIEAFSQELRLTSPKGDPVEFVAGLFYSDTTTHNETIQAGGLGLLPAPLRAGRGGTTDVYQRSYAAFGQATIHASDKLSFTVGGRYTDEFLKDNAIALTPAQLNALGFIYTPAFTNRSVSAEVSETNFSWRLGAQYAWTPRAMAYFTASRGYKGPAINEDVTGLDPVIQPEKPMYYELGYKGALFNGRVLATAALFHNKVDNFQTAVFVPSTPANPVPGFAQGNSPYMTSKGFELNLFGKPARNLSLNAGVIYNDAEYAPTFLVACNSEQIKGVGTCSALGTTSPVSQVANVPKWRFLVNGEYTRPVGQLEGFVQSDLTYQSSVAFNPSPNPVTTSGPQWLLGGRVGVRSFDGRWGVSVFGRNLLDKTYPYIVADPLGAFNGGAGKSYWTVPSMDWHRSFGLTLDARF
jgi:iron complex outermembrane receptor protein